MTHTRCSNTRVGTVLGGMASLLLSSAAVAAPNFDHVPHAERVQIAQDYAGCSATLLVMATTVKRMDDPRGPAQYEKLKGYSKELMEAAIYASGDTASKAFNAKFNELLSPTKNAKDLTAFNEQLNREKLKCQNVLPPSVIEENQGAVQ